MVTYRPATVVAVTPADPTPAGTATAVVDRPPLIGLPVAGAPQGFSPLAPDGQWQRGLRGPPGATGSVGQVSQQKTAVPDRLLVQLGGLADGHPDRARLRARVIEWYLPLTAYVARRFGGRGEPLDDLTQVAVIGLIKAVDRFDATRGVDFASYAIPTIVGEIKRHFRDTTWVIQVPRRLQELKLRVPVATEELLQELHRAPTTAELADRLGVREPEVVSALLCVSAYRPLAIERTVTDRPDLRPSDLLGGLDPDIEAVDNRALLRKLMGRLSAREQRILSMRFAADMSQTQIATEIGLSQMHVSRLLAKCLAQLRDGLATEVRQPVIPAPRASRTRPPTVLRVPAPRVPVPGIEALAA
jgi:RNA polymerase sigma-B factor